MAAQILGFLPPHGRPNPAVGTDIWGVSQGLEGQWKAKRCAPGFSHSSVRSCLLLTQRRGSCSDGPEAGSMPGRTTTQASPSVGERTSWVNSGDIRESQSTTVRQHQAPASSKAGALCQATAPQNSPSEPASSPTNGAPPCVPPPPEDDVVELQAGGRRRRELIGQGDGDPYTLPIPGLAEDFCDLRTERQEAGLRGRRLGLGSRSSGLGGVPPSPDPQLH